MTKKKKKVQAKPKRKEHEKKVVVDKKVNVLERYGRSDSYGMVCVTSKELKKYIGKKVHVVATT